MEKYDLVVIGSGPGGYPAAIRAAQLGASVALVEKDSLGGTCLNWGCIPTKTLIASSDLFHRARNADSMGLRVENASCDYAAMVERKDAVVEKLRGGVTQLLKGNKVTVFEGTGSFKDRNRIVVKKGKEKSEIEAANAIIATGAESTVPEFLPKHDRIVASRAFLARTELPESMIVLGGGIIGCEFACMAAQLGVKVTIVEMLEDIVLILDRDIRRELRRHMEKTLGVDVLAGASLEKVKADDKGVSGKAGDKRVSAELLLVSVGRQPVTQGLALDKVGLETDDGGYMPVDDYCQTRAPTIYAIGDVTGGTQLAHRATSQGLTAAENACGPDRHKAETVVPACIFTAPEIGSVGLSEQDAKAKGVKVRTGKYPFSALGKAMAIGETAGFVKWVADADTDQLLGAHAIGPHATELIAEATLAIRNELTARELGRTVHCHPTLAESWMEAAHAVHGESIHAAPKKRPK
jgi:dihydrolipoamide dehydrogenase